MLDRVVIDPRSSTVEGWMKTLLWKAESAGEPATIWILRAGPESKTRATSDTAINNIQSTATATA